MDRTLTSASLQVSALLQFTLDEEVFLQRYPNLVSELAKLDVPPDLRVLLPEDAYRDGQTILRLMDELRVEAIRQSQEGRLQKKPMLGLKECGEIQDRMLKQVEDLRDKLTKAYREAYD